MQKPLHTTLRQTRQDASLSSDRLSQALGLTLPTLTARERGERHLFPRETGRYLDMLIRLDYARQQQVVKAAIQLKRAKSVTGLQLRALRKQAGFSYQEIGHRLGAETRAETLRNQERSGNPWVKAAVLQYLETLDDAIQDRSIQLSQRVLEIIGSLPPQPIPPAVIVPRRVDAPQAVATS